MIVESLRDRLAAAPFEPFIVRATSGHGYRVADPGLAVLMRSKIFIAEARSDRAATVPYLHIAAIEEARPPRRRTTSGHRRTPKRR